MAHYIYIYHFSQSLAHLFHRTNTNIQKNAWQLEEEYPQPSMKNPDSEAEALMKSNMSFKFAREFTKAAHGSAEEKEKEQALLTELRAIESYLKTHPGPLIGGKDVSQADAAIAPKLYHLTTALPALKQGWKLPEEFVHIQKYLEFIKQKPSWKKTDYGEDSIVAGWKKFLAGSH